MIGTTLSHFKITAKLGEGGMGEVYRAEDTRLDREVAIKVLPEAFVANSERLARFEREAKTLAALDHPNIAGIYEIGEHDGTHFLAMQLVEGEDLAARLARGRLSVEDAFSLALQIAHALEAAHGKGIVHRDLKPGNIMVGSDGTVRVLDFGLAKTVEADSDETALSRSPTLTTPMTETGVILGTAAYMSPEQAKGEPVDSRTDVWAFGCVLYEMLTGKRPFAGRTVTETLAAVLEREVDWTALPESLPSLARSVLRRCLEKDPSRRLRDVGDARLELEEAIREPALGQEGLLPPAAVRSAVRRGVLWTLASLALAAALGTAGWFWTRPEPGSAPIRRFDLDPPAGVLLSRGAGGNALAVSPDGEWVVFLADRPEESSAPAQLYLRSVKEIETRPVPGTEDGTNPFFSPDGSWLGFHSRGAIRKVPLAGGEPLVICEVARLRGASWGEDGDILFSAGEGLLRVSAQGGEPEVVTTPEAVDWEVNHRWPHYLPGGREALFLVHGGTSEANYQIAVLSLETGEERTLLRGGTYPRYADGHLVYSRLGTLYAAPFDLERLELTGEPRPVLDDVHFYMGTASASYDLSRTGALVFNKGAWRLADAELVQLDRQGNVSPLAERRASYFGTPVFSPDGRRFAIHIQSSLQEADLWTYEPERDFWERLTSDGGIKVRSPVWTPDGASILFSSGSPGVIKIFRVAADGSGTPEQLTTGPDWDYVDSVSPDGRVLLFSRMWAPALWNILTLPLEGEDRTAQPIVGPPADEAQAVFSPDGRWVAYVSWETGRGEVYVRPYPGPGPKVRISTAGVSGRPWWSPDGRELFYSSGLTMWAVAVETEPEFVAGRPAPLMDVALPLSCCQVSPDGQRFLGVKHPEEGNEPLRQVYVPSWTEELKQAVSRRPS